jgi:hypothetical protein
LPSKDWIFNFANYNKGEFKAEYRTVLTVSKLTKIILISHEFSIIDENDKKISPTLGGVGKYKKRTMENIQ